MTLSRALHPASTDNIVTMLLHRATEARAWCHGVVLYQTAATRIGAEDAPALAGLVSQSARLGADGVLLSRADEDPRTPAGRQTGLELGRHAVRIGQKLIGSIDETSEDPDLLFAQARALMDYGLHGANVGRLAPHAGHLAAVAELCARFDERAITDFLLTGDTVGATQDAVLSAFPQGTAPLLRNDVLWRAGWDTKTVRTAVTATTRWYDATDSQVAWSIFAGADVSRPEVARLMTEPLGEVGRRRLHAAVLGLLAMPGAVVLRQGEEVGLLDLHEADDVAQACARVAEETGRQRGVPGSPYEIYRTALRLRRGMRLGTGSLHWVTFPDVPTDVVSFLNRDLLVISNLSEEEVEIARPDQVLHSSRRLETVGGSHLVLAPGTTLWMRLA